MQNFLHAAGATGAEGSGAPGQGPWQAEHAFANLTENSPKAPVIRGPRNRESDRLARD